MRRPTEAESHRARAALIEGSYPEGMRARCARCRRVEEISQGHMVATKPRSDGPSRLFLCSNCMEELGSSAA